jgi:hypothetical protein
MRRRLGNTGMFGGRILGLNVPCLLEVSGVSCVSVYPKHTLVVKIMALI